jgi:DNA-binding CsgD family transcriptional regulator
VTVTASRYMNSDDARKQGDFRNVTEVCSPIAQREQSLSSDVRLIALNERQLLLSLPCIGLPDTEYRFRLTQAERDVVVLAVRGFGNAAIALERGCTQRTVANLLAKAYKKMRISGRRELKAITQ